ncbi:MAG: ester cyclase [Phormidesmis sp.]
MTMKFLKSLPALMLLGLVACTSEVAVEKQNATGAAQASEVADASGGELTPAENNQIAVRMFEGAWNKGDFTVIDELIKADAIDHSPLGSETGSEGFKNIIGMFRGAMPELKMSIQDEIYAGDRVVHSWKIQGDHTGTPLFGVSADGKEITLTGITIVRLEDGKIAERWTQLDQLGLMTQLGIIPPMGEKPAE